MSDNIRDAERVMRQLAVYWPAEGFDASGQPIFGAPQEIKCRWDDVHEVFVDTEGNDQVSNAKVMVDRDLATQGQLWLGEMEDLESLSVPADNPGAYAIRKFEKIVDERGKRFLRIALL